MAIVSVEILKRRVARTNAAWRAVPVVTRARQLTVVATLVCATVRSQKAIAAKTCATPAPAPAPAPAPKAQPSGGLLTKIVSLFTGDDSKAEAEQKEAAQPARKPAARRGGGGDRGGEPQRPPTLLATSMPRIETVQSF